MRALLSEESERMASWTQELERFNRGEVEKHEDQHENTHKDLSTENKISYSYILGEESVDGAIVDYVPLSEVERLMEDKIKTVVEIATRVVLSGVGKEMTGDEFRLDIDVRKEGIEKPIISTVEGKLIDIVKKGQSNTIHGAIVYKLASYTCSWTL